MASFTSLPLLLSLPVIFSLVGPSVSSPTEKLTPTTVQRICNSTVNATLCFTTLQHDPHTKTLPLSQLTLSYVEKTRGIDKTIISLLEKLTEATNNASLKSSYSNCNYHYKLAVFDLNRAKRRISSGNFAGISDLAAGPMTAPKKCDDEFNDGQKYHKPSELVDSDMKLVTFGGIVSAMATLCMHA